LEPQIFVKRYFSEYMEIGGFPEIANLEDEFEKIFEEERGCL
jgi:predicted AAA+ superfamily ATPase